jgi:transposase
VRQQKIEGALVRALARDPLLADRVQRLMTIPAVGPITALTWALEVDDVRRFGSVKHAISYCGLCGAEKSSADIVKCTPLSKAKLAPRRNPDLAVVYDKEKQKGNANRATLAVARKLVAYLLAVDRGEHDFVVSEEQKPTAAQTAAAERKK